MRNLRSVLSLGVLLAIVSPRFVSAQITITSADLLGQICSTQIVLEDQRFNIPVNLGLPGANQVWDFRNQVIGDSLFSVNEFLSPDETVSAGSFPQANLVQKITDRDTPGFEVFNFYSITPAYFINLGDSSKFSMMGFDTSMVFFQSDTTAPLPIAFGNEWLTAERDTTGFFPLSATISIDTTLNRIDGWGTVRLPLGDFECLRLRQNVQVINQTIINGTLFSTSIDSFIQYNWIAKDIYLVARAQSRNGDTDPNFTIAQGFGRLDSLKMSPPTGVVKNSELPSDFVLFQNYPNPFNPSTTIQFALPQPGKVSLRIYNLLGREVALLVDDKLPAGIHRVVFDAKGLSSGLYFYRLQAGDFSQVQRLTLLK